MAFEAGREGVKQTIGSGEELCFDHALHDKEENLPAPTRIVVGSREENATEIVVRIPGLHSKSGGVAVLPGQREYFQLHNAIQQLYISGNGAVVDWGPVEVSRTP